MGEIIQFNPQFKSKKVVSDKERLKMIAKGRIEAYYCNNCDERFEVIDDNFPTECPGCGARINWENNR